MAYDIMISYLKKMKNIKKNRTPYDTALAIIAFVIVVLVLALLAVTFTNHKWLTCILSVICLVALISFAILLKLEQAYNESSGDAQQARLDKLKELKDVLSGYGIENDGQIRGLIGLYQKYLDECLSGDRKRSAIISLLFPVVISILKFSYEDMDINLWMYFAVFIIAVALTVFSTIYLFKYIDGTRGKYEMMVNHLQELLILNGNNTGTSEHNEKVL
jgi:predicted MFS family arabinose efflux permease